LIAVWFFAWRYGVLARVSQIVLVVAAGLAFGCLGAGGLNAQTAAPEAPSEPSTLVLAIVGFIVAVVAGVAVVVVARAINRHPGRPDQSPARKSESAPPPATSGTAPDRPKSPPPQDAPVVFISYRRHDSSDVAGRIYDRLIQRFGSKGVFKDVDSIPLGVDFRKHLADSVGQCRILLAIIGRSWSASGQSPSNRALDDPRDFVRIELETAFQRGIPVIPVLVQGAAIPAEDQLPASLQSLAYHNGLAVRPDPDFHQDMVRLIRGIEHHVGIGS
jgi:hypothetical protein